MADSNKPNSSRNHDDKLWKAMGLVTAFGIEIALLAVAGYYAGSWLDQTIGGNGIWIAVSVLFFIAAGGVSIYFIAKKFMGENDE
ncbi:hypothetical protein PAECIP112173_03116 [Paenibacillus sp. JJ-100]|uniref:AtpZ/AtpI family protein n=1 Tax=Paenibacillus sp. JJ-100 TaxID=2974896 RepID=UPI0022FF826A|nr:AtpZ/AtpI family protein [Paenibacillus sp. JJ-100]CAI6081125.1 hypothetical protein PAECIP112173_03116 [Paenibacillus sp. JJ-100]